MKKEKRGEEMIIEPIDLNLAKLSISSVGKYFVYNTKRENIYYAVSEKKKFFFTCKNGAEENYIDEDCLKEIYNLYYLVQDGKCLGIVWDDINTEKEFKINSERTFKWVKVPVFEISKEYMKRGQK